MKEMDKSSLIAHSAKPLRKPLRNKHVVHTFQLEIEETSLPSLDFQISAWRQISTTSKKQQQSFSTDSRRALKSHKMCPMCRSKL